MDLFGAEEGGFAAASIVVNDAFAAKLSRAGALASRQRRGAVLAASALPVAAEAHFVKAIKKAAAFELMKLVRKKKQAESEKAGLAVGQQIDAIKSLSAVEFAALAAAKAGIPLMTAPSKKGVTVQSAASMAATSRVLCNKHTREAIALLIRASKKAAFSSGTNGKVTAKGAPSGTSVGTKRAINFIPPEASDGAPSAAKRQRGGGCGEDDWDDDHVEACDIHDEPPENPATDCVLLAPCHHAVSETRVSLVVAPPSKELHVHGRGAGRGRGLHPFHGEPLFEDMHPSWQARRRARGRQGKIVHRALNEAAATAVEVVSSAVSRFK